MLNTIQPREAFPISRAIADPADSSVYYVQAVVRNAKTGTTIDTVNLASLGSGIFALSWETPADPSGRGLFITITTRVYTDSGHTALSDTYGQEQDTYLVYDRFKFVQGLATQISALGVSDIDYKRIKHLITDALSPVKTGLEAVASAVAAVKIPENKPLDLSPISSLLVRIESVVAGLKNTDVTELEQAIKETKAAVDSLEMPEQEKVDLSPVLAAIKALDIPKIDEELLAKTFVENVQAKLTAADDKMVEKWQEKLEESTAGVRDAMLAGSLQRKKPQNSPEKPPMYVRGRTGAMVRNRVAEEGIALIPAILVGAVLGLLGLFGLFASYSVTHPVVEAQTVGAGGGTISTLDMWTSTTSPSAAITQRTFGKAIKITGLTTGLCLSLDANSMLTTSACSGAGSGFSTTSTDYWKTQRNFFSTTSTDYWETQQTPRGGSGVFPFSIFTTYSTTTSATTTSLLTQGVFFASSTATSTFDGGLWVAKLAGQLDIGSLGAGQQGGKLNVGGGTGTGIVTAATRDFDTPSGENMQFGTAGTLRAVFDTSGNFGIASSVPNHTLSIGTTQNAFYVDSANGGAWAKSLNLNSPTSANDSAYSFTEDSSDILTLTRSKSSGDNGYTLLELDAPSLVPRESTITLKRATTSPSTCSSFLDLYNDAYFGGTIQYGLRVQKRGTCSGIMDYQPLVFDFYDGVTVTPAFIIATNTANTTLGNIGISTTTPGSRLSVQGNQFIAGNITSTSTTASIFPYASTTAISGTNLLFTNATTTAFATTIASTSLFYGAQLATCQAGNFLTWNGGSFGCAADTVGGGGSFPFTAVPLYGATQANSTSTLIGFLNGIYTAASSTFGGDVTVQGNATTSGSLAAGANGFIVSKAGTITNLGGVANVSLTGASLQLSNNGGNVLVQNNSNAANSTLTLDSGASANDASNGVVFKSGGAERARFTGAGLFGFNTSTPMAQFAISTRNNATPSNNLMFVVASSTLTATTTLFSIDNTGAASTTKLFGAQLSTCDPTTGKITFSNGTFGCGTDFNTGGGGTFSYTPTTFGGVTANATDTTMWFRYPGQYSIVASSSLLDYASTTALSVSGSSYLGTVKSGTWNGTKIAIANGGTNNSLSYTAGGLLVPDGTGITQTASLSPFYDIANDRLGVNDITPDFRFETVGSSGTGYLGVTQTADGDVFNIASTRNVGISTTSPYAMLSVAGNVVAANFVATSTATANIFPYASSTALTAGNLFSTNATTTSFAITSLTNCDTLDTDNAGNVKCGTDATGGGGGSSGFAYGTLTFSTSTAATSTSIWLNGGSFFSSSTVASQFPYASSTMLSAITASTTNFTIDTVTSALALGGATGVIGEYAGSAPCTNQVALSLSATGVITCTSVSNAMLTNSGAINFTYVGNVSGSATGAPGGTVTVTVPWEYGSKSSFGTTTISTTTSITTQGVFFSSSTAQSSQFPYASTTMLSAVTASTTNLTVDTITSALALAGATGVMGEYAGSSGTCTNQFPMSISAVGVLGTCTSVADSYFTGQLGLSHGGTNASLSGANQITFMNAGNTALATNASSLFGWQDAANWLVIGTSTSAKALVTLGTSTAPQLTLTDNNNTNAIAFREVGNAFYISSTSPTTYATSTNPILSVVNFVSTFFTQFLVKITSATAFAIQDSFGTAVVNVNTASTTGSIFTVAATTSPDLGTGAIKLFDVDQYGHLTASSTRATPTVSCTPSGGTITANSNDVTGDITGGTLSTACTITFASAYAVTPEVFLTPSSATQAVAVTARSTTAFTIGFAGAISNDNVSYFVIQP